MNPIIYVTNGGTCFRMYSGRIVRQNPAEIELANVVDLSETTVGEMEEAKKTGVFPKNAKRFKTVIIPKQFALLEYIEEIKE